MQLSAQAQVAPGGPAANAAAAAAAAASLPPGLLAGHPAAAPAAAGAPPGLPSTLSLLASIPTSLAQQAAAAGAAAAANPAAAAAAANLPHPAFASLLAQQKPGSLQEAVAKAKEDELKRALETNGGELIRNCFAATEVRKGFAVPAFIALCSRVLSTTRSISLSSVPEMPLLSWNFPAVAMSIPPGLALKAARTSSVQFSGSLVSTMP